MDTIPTDRELEALKVLWRQGEATVREIYQQINAGGTLAYTTVLSLLQTMEQKGLAGHRKEGKTYQYFAKVERESTFRTLASRPLEPRLRGGGRRILGSRPAIAAAQSRRIKPAGKNDCRGQSSLQAAEGK